MLVLHAKCTSILSLHIFCRSPKLRLQSNRFRKVSDTIDHSLILRTLTLSRVKLKHFSRLIGGLVFETLDQIKKRPDP